MEYIYSRSKYNFEVFVLKLSIFIFYYFILPCHYILEANIAFFGPSVFI